MKLGIFVAVSMLAVPFAAMGQAGRALYGIIHTADDQPVANARVTVTGVGGSSTTTSTRMGEFQFHNLATGSYTVTVAHPSYRLREPVRVIVYEDKRIDLEVELQDGASTRSVERGILSGELRTADGGPAPSIVLTIRGPEERRAAQYETVSNDSGEYRLKLLPGTYRIRVQGQTFTLVPAEAVFIESGKETRQDLILTLHELVEVAGLAPDATRAASNPGMRTRVVEAEEIEDREASSFVAVMRDLPGVAVSRKGGVGSETAAYIRGGASNYALVLIDGIPANDPGGEFDFGKLLPLQLGRVEVTRGAASSIYGGALSGVVQLSTQRAGADETRLLVSGEGGSFSWDRIQGGTSGRTDNFDWNVGVIRLQTDNEVPNNAFSQLGAAASLGARLGERTSVRVIFRGETGSVGTPGPTSLIRPDLDASDEQDRLVLGATIRHTAGATEHILRGGLSRTNKLSLNPEDSGPIDIEPPEGDASEFRFVIPDFASPDGLANDTQRFNFAYQADVEQNQHLFSLGGELERQTGEFGVAPSEAIDGAAAPQGFGGFLARLQQLQVGTVPERTNVAGFLQDRILLGDSMILTAGGRVERNGSFGTRALPRAAFAWTLGFGTTLKASAGMGLKEPSLEQSFGGSFRIQGNPELLPERSRTLDAGIRKSFLDGRLWTEGTVFYHQYRDQIVLGNIDVPAFATEFTELTLEERQEIRRQIRAGERERFELQVDFDQFRPSYVNLGKTRGKGYELSFGGSPFEALRFRGDYTFLDTAVLEGNNEFLEGEPLPNRPRQQLSLSAHSELGRVSVGATLLFVGERRADRDFVSLALGLTTVDAYTRFDLRTRVALSAGFEAYVVAENLFDRSYEEVLGYPALGRLVRLGLS